MARRSDQFFCPTGIYDVDGIETMAFTDFGLENLRELISDQIDRAP